MGTGKNFGEYIPETDTITLRPSYKSVREFLMTILHEIKHALDAQNLGKRKLYDLVSKKKKNYLKIQSRIILNFLILKISNMNHRIILNINKAIDK